MHCDLNKYLSFTDSKVNNVFTFTKLVNEYFTNFIQMIDNQGEKFKAFLKALVKSKTFEFEGEFINMETAARMLGYTKQNLYSKFKSKRLDYDSVKNILNTFKVSESELWGSDEKHENSISPFYKGDNMEPNLWLVPFKSYAGFLRGYGDGLATDSNIQKIYYPLIKGEAFAIQVGGQSAFPVFPENTWFCGKPVDCPEDLVKGRLYTWQTVDGMVTKIFDGMDDDNFYVSSVNPDYNPVDPLRRKDVKVIYRQVGKLDSFEN